ncbi:MAG: hypothetical protein LUQ11_01525 [Methylococcaceae bacterium]|nr:hypothetical protein [Methylococcaceae bacterium]
MKRSTFKLQGGIGLIEVLIAMVVVAVGLVAVATLQGHLMSDSGDNKTRSEALALAERKIEELRNNANVAGYQAITAGTTTESNIVGTNATFTRSWTIGDVTGFLASAPNRKNISVQVSWDGNGNGVVDGNERVEVITQMAWIDPGKSALLADINSGAGTAQVPSPRQNASEDVASEQVLNTEWTDVQSGGVPGTSTTMTVEVTNPTTHNVVSVQLRQIAPGSHFYATADTNLFFVSPGVIAVFLCYPAGEGGADLSTEEGHCKYIQNHFGGIPLRIAGTVYSTSGNGFVDEDGVRTIQVAWTSSDVNACYNGNPVRHPSSGTLIYDSMPYECVLAGNCNATAGGATAADFGATGCYPDNQVSDAQINDRDVGPGGEYGDVGLLGVDDQGGNREQVCFLEDTTDPATSVLLQTSGSEVQNENYLFAVTNRFYASRRISRSGTSNQQDSEGINRSYTNHNFLIIARGTGASANQRCNIAATANSIQLAPRDIIRTLNQSGAPNEVLAETSYTGTAVTAKTYTGSITSDATSLRFYIPEIGACYLNNNSSPQTTATLYACAVAGNVSGIDIKGGSAEYPTSNPAAFAACNKTTDATVCNWHNNFVTTSTTSCQTPWGATIADGSTTTAYLNAVEPFGGTCQSETRTCTTGTLSGTFTNQSCTVSSTADCTSPWGTSVPNGTAITAYANATVPTGFTCTDNNNSESRTCTNGILSGTYTHVSCAVQTTRNISVSVTTSGTGSVSGITLTGTDANCSGLICTVANDWTGTLSATGSCSGGGTVSGISGTIPATATTASIALGNCTGPVCTTPWSTSLASGGSVMAYQAATVNYPSSCVSETRFCNDGTLSGTYSNQSCSVVCTVPNLIGRSTNSDADKSAVNNAITAAGFSLGTSTDTGSGQKEVSAQSPAAGSTPACGSAVGYSYN